MNNRYCYYCCCRSSGAPDSSRFEQLCGGDAFPWVRETAGEKARGQPGFEKRWGKRCWAEEAWGASEGVECAAGHVGLELDRPSAGQRCSVIHARKAWGPEDGTIKEKERVKASQRTQVHGAGGEEPRDARKRLGVNASSHPVPPRGFSFFQFLGISGMTFASTQPNSHWKNFIWIRCNFVKS